MKAGLSGNGVDRHLNALKYQLLEGEKCELFDDPTY